MRKNRTIASSSPVTKSPAFQVYPAEFLTDERVALMNNRELGAYFRLLCSCWREQSIPCDPALLARLCGESVKEMTRMIPVIAACFVPDPHNGSRLIHQGLDQERKKQQQFKQKARERGTKGAASRWKREGSCSGHAHGMLKDGFPIPPPIPNTPKAPKGAVRGGADAAENARPAAPAPSKASMGSIPSIPSSAQCLEETRTRIGAILKRPAGSAWSPAEMVALGELQPPTPAEVNLLTRFYHANIPADKDRRRTSLGSLLRNWSGEIDKARGYFLALELRNSAL